MNKPFYIFLFIMLFCCEAKTQTNLIYNGDFEIYDTCPTNISTPGDLQIEHCLGWTAPTKLATSDYFNVCNNASTFLFAGVPRNLLGYQQPYNGNAYCGILASIVDSTGGQPYIYREYIQTKLLQKLDNKKMYAFSFYINASNGNTHSLKKIGALFSSSNFTANTFVPIFANPQIVNRTIFLSDTLNWIKIEGNFESNGNEEYLTIGYFENETIDTLNNHYDSFNPYYRILSYYYIDGLTLKELPCNVNIPNVFTPNNDQINDEFKLEMCDTLNFNISIYNRWGNTIFESNSIHKSWDGKDKQGNDCDDGTYYFVATAASKKEKGFVQLLR